MKPGEGCVNQLRQGRKTRERLKGPNIYSPFTITDNKVKAGEMKFM